MRVLGKTHWWTFPCSSSFRGGACDFSFFPWVTKGCWFGLNSKSAEPSRCMSQPSDGLVRPTLLYVGFAMPTKTVSQLQINHDTLATFCAKRESPGYAFYIPTTTPAFGFLKSLVMGWAKSSERFLCSLSLLIWRRRRARKDNGKIF